jgi:Zn-dependent M28 family amino/carboxypeptidase
MGSAVVLEMARVMAASPVPPRRSIAFLLVTGEERGLLGSDFFAQHPSVAGAAIVANLNVDMPLFLHPVADLVAFGAEHSTLGELARAAAEANGFRLSPDPEPEESIFVRSDQYSFVRQGVPAIYLDPGHGSREPGAADGKAAVAAFRDAHYHRPSDESDLPTDWDGVARFAATNAALARAVADADDRPRWHAGSFFGELFGGSAARVSGSTPGVR